MKRKNVGYVICGSKEFYGIDADADDEGKEGIQVKGVYNLYVPAQLEIEEHRLTHSRFRDWCPHCVQGKGVSAARKKRKEEETQVPVSMDYMGLTKREPGDGEDPIIALVDSKT